MLLAERGLPTIRTRWGKRRHAKLLPRRRCFRAMSFSEQLFFQHHVAERLHTLFLRKLHRVRAALPEESPPDDFKPLWSQELERDLDHAADVLVAAWCYPGEFQFHMSNTRAAQPTLNQLLWNGMPKIFVRPSDAGPGALT